MTGVGWPSTTRHGITITEQEARAFVGPRADRYLYMWSGYISGRSPWPRINFAAVLAGPFWLAYRKLYALAALWWVGVFLVGFAALQGAALPIDAALSNLLGGLGIGLIGNYAYLSKAQRVVERLRRDVLDPAALEGALRRSGGASWVAVFRVMLIGYMATALLLAALVSVFGAAIDYQPLNQR